MILGQRSVRFCNVSMKGFCHMKNSKRWLISFTGLSLVCGVILLASTPQVASRFGAPVSQAKEASVPCINQNASFLMSEVEKEQESLNQVGGASNQVGEPFSQEKKPSNQSVEEENKDVYLDHGKTDTTSKQEGEPSASSPKQENKKEFTIVIDAGHQIKSDESMEPIGPGATETKKKVSSGTQGRFTNVPEYQVNLEVASKLRDQLVKLGYTVVMVRETNEVNLSNSQRAAIANEVNADAFIRLHCNGSENKNKTGILTICQTKVNKYCGDSYEESRLLSDCLLSELVKETKANNCGVMETDTMSGINWSRVPATIVEMGYMTNEKEDHLLVSEEYQGKLVAGLVKGIEVYFQQK